MNKYSNGLTEKMGDTLYGHIVEICDVREEILTPQQSEFYGIKISEAISGVKFGLLIGGGDSYCRWFMANLEEIQQLLKVTGAETIKDLNGESVEAMMCGFSVLGLRLMV